MKISVYEGMTKRVERLEDKMSVVDSMLGERTKRIKALEERLGIFFAQPAVRNLVTNKRSGCCGHSSDCAVHNEPAYPAGKCDCGFINKRSGKDRREGAGDRRGIGDITGRRFRGERRKGI